MEGEREEGDGPMRVRLYVGGLGPYVSSQDMEQAFSAFGPVLKTDTVRTKGRSFGYLDMQLASPKDLKRLFSLYNGCMWKGGCLKLEKAKEHFSEKLRREHAEHEASLKDAMTPKEDLRLNQKSHDSHIVMQPDASDSIGLKIYFPKLRKVKLVPMKGLGKHKRSFERAETLPLSHLKLCSCQCCYGMTQTHSEKMPEERQKTATTLKPGDKRARLSQGGKDDKRQKKLLAEKGTPSGDCNVIVDRIEKAKMVISSDKQLQSMVSCDEEELKNPTEDTSYRSKKASPNASNSPKDLVDNSFSQSDDDSIVINAYQSLPSGSGLKEDKQKGTKLRLEVDTSISSERNRQKEETEQATDAISENEPTHLDGLNTESNTEVNRKGLNWVQKASWKDLFGESGNARFSLSGILSSKSPSANPSLTEKNMHQLPKMETIGKTLSQQPPQGELVIGTDKIKGFNERDGSKVADDLNPITRSFGCSRADALKAKSSKGFGSERKESAENRKRQISLADVNYESPLSRQEQPPSLAEDDNVRVCTFMRSSNAEKEWLQSKRALRDIVKNRHKDALRRVKKLQRNPMKGSDFLS